MAGRPSKYRKGMAKQASRLCELGATDTELAKFFEVNPSTIYKWCHDYPEFSKALKVGKAAADARVERSLYRRAVGYRVGAVKIFMPGGATEPVYARYTENVQPDTTAQIFWLKNRKPDVWREKSEVKHDASETLMALLRANS